MQSFQGCADIHLQQLSDGHRQQQQGAELVNKKNKNI